MSFSQFTGFPRSAGYQNASNLITFISSSNSENSGGTVNSNPRSGGKNSELVELCTSSN